MCDALTQNIRRVFSTFSTLFYVLLALIMLGVLVMVHEAGHFFVARFCGIEVMEFSIGMGPKIWSRTGKKGTVYSLRAFPVGGYCKFYGEDEDNEDPRAYNKQAVWKRALSVVAGPLMNFVVAIVIVFVFVSAIGEEYLQIQAVNTGEPAQEAGLRPGDALIYVNGSPIMSTAQVTEAIAASEGEPVTLTVMREGGYENFQVSPRYSEGMDAYAIGVTIGGGRVRLPLLTSLQVSVNWNISAVKSIWEALAGLITRGEGVENMAGPVGTINMIQQGTRSGGLDMYLKLAAMISINLGIMNLLPIPGLDGSRLIFFGIEAIRRKPVNPNVEGMIHMCGFVLLMLVVVVFTYKDILRIFA